MSKKSSSLEFMIIVLGAILKNLVDITEEQPEQEPDFVETKVIDYGPSKPPEIPEDRPDTLEDLIGDPAQITPITTSITAPDRTRF